MTTQPIVANVELEPDARLIAAPRMLDLLTSLAGAKGIDVDDVNTGHNASYRDMARALLREIHGEGA